MISCDLTREQVRAELWTGVQPQTQKEKERKRETERKSAFLIFIWRGQSVGKCQTPFLQIFYLNMIKWFLNKEIGHKSKKKEEEKEE